MPHLIFTGRAPEELGLYSMFGTVWQFPIALNAGISRALANEYRTIDWALRRNCLTAQLLEGKLLAAIPGSQIRPREAHMTLSLLNVIAELADAESAST